MNKLVLPGPKAQALIERDKKVISSSYPRAYPFVMDHGKGVEVWDADGNRFIDFMAGIAVLSTGHANPRVVKSVQDAAEKTSTAAGSNIVWLTPCTIFGTPFPGAVKRTLLTPLLLRWRDKASLSRYTPVLSMTSALLIPYCV